MTLFFYNKLKTNIMNNKLLFILFLLLFVNKSNANLHSTTYKEVAKIDMEKNEIICFDSLVEDISCIKLDKNIFNSCNNMIRYKDYLYFLGNTIAGKNIVIYNSVGKFIKELTFSDAFLVNSISIIPELDELWVVSRFKVISKFKLNGTLVKKISLPFACAHILPIDKHNYLIYSGGGCDEQGCIEGHFMALTDFKSIKKLFIPKWGKRRRPYAAYNLYATNANLSNIFIFPTNIDTIYFYNSNNKEVKPFYSLDFHGKFVTKENYPDDDEMSEIIKKRKYIYSHNSFYQASDKLFFKLTGKCDDLCIINIKDNSLYSCEQLFDNFHSRFLNPIIGSDGESIYLLVWEKDILEHYKKNVCSYSAIKKILPSLSEDSKNWILIKIKIKQKI